MLDAFLEMANKCKSKLADRSAVVDGLLSAGYSCSVRLELLDRLKMPMAIETCTRLLVKNIFTQQELAVNNRESLYHNFPDKMGAIDSFLLGKYKSLSGTAKPITNLCSEAKSKLI